MKKKVDNFNTRLKPFDELYTEMYSAIRKRLEAMTEAEINQIMLDAQMPSSINCGWTTFEVAKLVREIAPYVAGIDTLPKAIEPTAHAQADKEE